MSRWFDWWEQNGLAVSVRLVVVGAMVFSALPIFY